MRRLPYRYSVSGRIPILFLLVCLYAVPSTLGWSQNSPHEPMTIPCTDCHSTESWKELANPMKFNHSTTGFPLNGQHANVMCVQCHTAKKFSGIPTNCFSCHQNDYGRAQDPNHLLGKFSHDCMTCHTFNGWHPSIFQHSKTNFQLLGAHMSVSCIECHSNNVFAGLTHDCYICHQKDFNAVAIPNHVASQFSHECLTCHTMNAWQPSTFDHNKTGFTLVGAHTNVPCASCHAMGRFTGTPTDCYSCHQNQFAQTLTPNHVAGRLSHDCVSCHTMNAWSPSTFDHAKTNFPLVGAHQAVDCAGCHSSGQFQGLSTDCYACHQKQFSEVVSPNHVQGQFSHDCSTCHSLLAWKPATFDHAQTIFPLLGAHKTAECSSCHVNGQFTGLPTDCYPCHQKQFTEVVSPNHVQGLFDHDCTPCHSMDAWKPSTFDHAKTTFPLIGAHQSVECASCHVNGQYKGLPTDCYSCHQQQFAETTSPNHVQSQFSHDCTTCHSLVAWQPSTFDHSKTNFPLTGAHATTDCLFCHKNGQFTGTPTDCWSCHSTDFTSVTDPNHVTNSFDHNCTTCHSMTAWSPATFDHNKTSFPLTGAHLQLQCTQCHGNGKFAGTPTECFVCHQTNYNSATDPNHVTWQYPTTCTTCHSTAGWTPWIFNHDTYFRVDSHHRNRASCNDCHRTPGTFTAYSCTTGCHSDAHHKNEACYPCHTR